MITTPRPTPTALLALLLWPVLACLAAALLCPQARAQAAAGIHLVTWHSEPSYQVEQAGAPEQHRYRTATPGLYIRLDNGLTAGVFSNSFGHPAAHVGWTAETSAAALPGGLQLAVTAGAVLGYRHDPLIPALLPSVRVPLVRSAGLRLTYLPRAPKGEHRVEALHLGVEWTL
jgi:hypothetical protein